MSAQMTEAQEAATSITQIEVIKETNLRDFTFNVNKLLKDGWTLHGEALIKTAVEISSWEGCERSDKVTTYIQVLRRDIKQELLPTKNIPTAAEARQKVIKNLSGESLKQFNELASKINEAIAKGQTQLITCLNAECLKSAVKAKLKSLGYRVDYETYCSSWCIYW